MTPGQGHFWPQVYNLNNFGRVLLDDVTHRISNLSALHFQRSRFFKFLLHTYIQYRELKWFLHFVTVCKTIWTILLELHARNITGKFHQIWPSGFWEEVLCIKSWRWMHGHTDGQMIRRQQIVITKNSPWAFCAQVS
jgi:hypothetical protein